MGFDDDDSKIRRNLVVYSSLVLTLAWFELPLGTMLELVLPKELVRPPDYKLWTLGFVILAYLGVRFSFMAEAKNFRELALSTTEAQIYYKCRHMVDIDCYLYTLFGRDMNTVEGGLTNLVNHVVKNKVHPGLHQHLGRPVVRIHSQIREASPWRYGGSVDLLWFDRKGRQIHRQGGFNVDLVIRGLPKFVALAWAKLNVWIYSDVAVQFLIPALFGLAANCVLWSRVIQAYGVA